VDDAGARMFVCSDSDYCQGRRAARRAYESVDTRAVPLLTGRGLTKRYDGRGGCVDVDIDIYPARCFASSANPARGNPRC